LSVAQDQESKSKVKVFISYAGPDVQFASMLTKSLERDGFNVFFAPRDIEGGQDWQDALGRELKGSDKVVLVLSRQTGKSRWMNLEFKVIHKQAGEKLVPILIDDTVALRETERFLEELNPFLALLQFIDFRIPQHVDSAYQMLVAALGG
jgi:hypothetical protein